MNHIELVSGMRVPGVSQGLALCLALGLVVSSGCLFSDSSESLSDSISSPFKVSSSSSSDDDDEAAYREDVSDYTLAFAATLPAVSSPIATLPEATLPQPTGPTAVADEDLAAFRKGIGALAERHAITNWEEDAVTCEGIGAGLARARFDSSAARRFASNLVGADPARQAAFRVGYERTRSLE